MTRFQVLCRIIQELWNEHTFELGKLWLVCGGWAALILVLVFIGMMFGG